jgi:hypothetical protein
MSIKTIRKESIRTETPNGACKKEIVRVPAGTPRPLKMHRADPAINFSAINAF